METDLILETAPQAAEATPIFEYNEYGLVKGVEYKFKKSGYRRVVDWRAMVLPEYLVLNRQFQKEMEEKYGKPMENLSVSEVEDKYLLILLSGIRELAELRGYYSVIPTPTHVSNERCTVQTVIEWIPNFETGMHSKTTGGVADATPENTAGFGSFFLSSIAENRAFVRAVRNFLGINIVGQDEVGGKAKKDAIVTSTLAFSSNAYLEKECSDRKITFEAFKKRVIEGYRDKLKDANPEAWVGFADLKAIDATNLLKIIKSEK